MKDIVIYSDSNEVKRYISMLGKYGIGQDIKVFDSVNLFQNAIEVLLPEIIIVDDKKIKLNEFSEMIIRSSWRVFRIGTLEISSINNEKFKFYISYRGEGEKFFDEKLFYNEITETMLTEYLINSCKKLSDGVILTAIKDFFVKIGLYSNLLGYEYLLEAIRLSYADKRLINSVTTDLYPLVAERFSTNPRNVERNMRNAIEISCNRGKFYEIANSIGGNFDVYEKPSNSEFIAFLIDRISVFL